MNKWNGHYKDYDFFDPNYTLEHLKGIEEYTQRNVEYAQANGDHSALEYYMPKLIEVRETIRKFSH